MKIAIPMAQGQLCPHFGHCEQFAMLEVNEQTKEILSIEYVEAPPHQPGFYPLDERKECGFNYCWWNGS